MAQKRNIIKVKVSEPFNDVTEQFFNHVDEKRITEQYAVARLGEQTYALVNKGGCDWSITFTNISRLPYDTYLITNFDATQSLIHFSEGDEVKVVESENFIEVIKTFNRYVLVKKLDGEIVLIPIYKNRDFSYVKWIEDFSIYGDQNHVVLDLPNNKKEILLKDNLKPLSISFDFIYPLKDTNINNIYRIVGFKGCGQHIVRISDGYLSQEFTKVEYLGEKRGFSVVKPLKDYVKVYIRDKAAVMRVKDFKLSKFYDEITYCTSNFVLVKENGKENILRLSDFEEAKWTKEV